MSIILKGAVTLGGMGVAVGGGFLANSLILQNTSKNTLINKLKRDGFTPLNTDTSRTESQNSDWRKILTSYSSLIKTKPLLKLTNLSFEANDETGINKLKDACASLLKTQETSSSFTNDYKLESKWCVEPISVGDLLSKRGFSYLSTESSTETSTWTEMAKKYERDKNANKSTLMSDLSWETVSNSNYTSNITKMQSSCKTRKFKNSHEDEFEKYLSEAEMWCSVAK
ncbi:hypothetical protein MHC_05020 [Mycoplasma haemocanis str. Illinois]|uniref:Uncharacterized protein n=1 Tax=Mycoplasma haemocanis (strain Illinois) TaxID=1111676 RepID=H6N888_MYCHN|nr:hypothetical protein [Mycoplasma haemocanis]AEW45860.1 hypothetical protein MHC_05020 [Mycoplasma haemocanis str. Illinois]